MMGHDNRNSGRYSVQAPLAAGGMAQVYRAWDTVMHREVALKMLAPELMHDPVRVERFKLEALRISVLSHPNIVPLLDHGERDGRLFLVMPIYPTTLRDVLQQQGTLTMGQTVYVVAQVAGALDYAHEHGIIHRDIKPENVLLDASGHALLADFGIAKSAPSAPSNLMTAAPLAAAEAGQLPIASVEYSSPEHLLGRPIDRRADVYGLAILAYETLTGTVPFTLDSERIYTLVMRMLTEVPVPPSRLTTTPLPAEVDAVVLRALNSDPNRRYPTAGEFSLALSAAQHGTTPAPPPRPTSPLLFPPSSPTPVQRTVPVAAPPYQQPYQPPYQQPEQYQPFQRASVSAPLMPRPTLPSPPPDRFDRFDRFDRRVQPPLRRSFLQWLRTWWP